MRFGDRNVVVTGSAQGIGRGIVQAFLDEGASVFAADIDADGLRGTAALAARAATEARDSEARFALGLVRFAQAVEHLGQSLYRHGLRPPKSPRELRRG